MPKILPSQAIEQYQCDGYYFPLKVLGDNEVTASRAQLERFEKSQDQPLAGAQRNKSHLLFKWVGPDRCMFGSEKPGIGTAKDPKTGEWIDDVKKKIDAIDWLSESDRQRIFEGTATEVYKLKF